jgi:hypothetical protein
MTRFSQDTAMGTAIAIASLLLLVREQWFLDQTEKGQTLVRWFGAASALWVLRGILLAMIALGALLASGVVRPIFKRASVSDDSQRRYACQGIPSGFGDPFVFVRTG